jgi:WD40 repeat protein
MTAFAPASRPLPSTLPRALALLGALAGLGVLLALALPLLVAGQPPGGPGAQAPAKQPPALLDRHGDALPPRALARLGTVRFRQESHVLALAFSPDGKTLASAGESVRLWETATGRLLHRRRPPKTVRFGFAAALAFTRDGKALACAGTGGVIFVDPATGRVLREVATAVREVPLGPEHGDAVLWIPHDLMFTRGGDTLGLVHPDRTVSLFELTKGKETWHLGKERGERESVHLALSPDGKRLALVIHGKPEFWDVTARKRIPHGPGFPGDVWSLVFFPDGRTVAFSGRGGRIRLWDISAWKELRRLPGHRGGVSHLAVSPDGKLLVSGSFEDDSIRVWDPATGKERHRIATKMSGHLIFASAFSPDGRTLALGYRDQSVHLWDLTTGKERRSPRGHRYGIEALAFSADGKSLRTCDFGGFRRWDVATGKPLAGPPASPAGHSCLAFSPGGTLMASTSYPEPAIHLNDVATGKELRKLTAHEKEVHGLVFSADGTRLASGGADGLLCLWDPASGRQLRRFQNKEEPRPLACSPDGRIVAWASRWSRGGHALHLWDTRTGREHLQLKGHKGAVFSAAFAPDGRTLASCGHDGSLRLWETATGKEVLRFGGRPRVSRVLFAPDGATLASWSPGELLLAGDRRGWFSEESLRVWDPATGKELCRLGGHQGPVRAAAFSPDGKLLATGGEDTTALLWDLTAVPRGGPAPRRLSPRELNALWADLARDDAARAYRAVVALCAAPGQSVPFLRQHLRPFAADLHRIPGLIADLNHKQFAVRGKAVPELEALHELAVPALRQALTADVFLEAKRRIEQLLEKCERYGVPPGEPLRALRALMALERVSNAGARQTLEGLAKGTPGAWLTREAQAALRRLARRAAAAP